MEHLGGELTKFGVMSVSYIARKYKYSFEGALDILCKLAKKNSLVKFDRTNRRLVYKKPYELRRELRR